MPASDNAPSDPSIAATFTSDATVQQAADQTLWRAATIVAEDTHGPAVSTMEDEGTLPPSEFTNRYEIREVLGRGGMGEVRLCRDGAVGRDVALKTLLQASESHTSASKGFLREVRVQGQLEHPAIVPVYDLGVGPDGGLYFTMRRVRGKTLAEVLRELARSESTEAREKYSRRRLLVAFVQVCLAVDYAHARGVVHRDLKPANIMLGDFGEVYVLDWGVAGIVSDSTAAAPVVAPGAELASQRTIAGTPGYMAPEQLLGLGANQDARTDVYALGAILYEMLTLKPLHRGTLGEVARATVAGVVAAPSKLAPDVPPELDTVCLRATAGEPAARHANARELAHDIERFLDGDRDLARRKEIAEAHMHTARQAAERTRSSDPSTSEDARAEALREVFAALALDSEIAEARGLLAQLLLEVPANPPPAVEAEIAQESEKALQHTIRFGVYSFISWALTIPFVAAMGVLDWRAFTLASSLCIAAAAYCIWLWRGHASKKHLYPIAILIAGLCASLSCWLGPFILVPVAGATTTIWISLQADRRQRWPIALIGGAGMVLPVALEILGVVPPSMTFVGDTLEIHARALHLPPFWTTLALTHVSVTFCMFQPLLLGGLRDALATAERKLWLQAWHLRQLASGSPPAR